jgi:hypothetical protein
MEQDLNRQLSVTADNRPVRSFRHAHLSGRDAVGLDPLPFTVRLWNLSESDYHLLAAAKEISVSHGDTVLASGQISDVCRRSAPEGTVTEVVFSPGLSLWEAPVSLSVEAGVSVSETLERILSASGTGIPLLSFPGEDPVRTRGQAFFGRAAECVNEALSAAKARACLTPSGLCVIPEEGLPVSMELTEADLTDAPSPCGEKMLVATTRLKGWLPGKRISLKWQEQQYEGLVIMRSVDADNLEGNWESELLIEVSS